MMKIRFFKIVCLICVITFLNCNTTAISEVNKQNINSDAIQKYDGNSNSGSFIIKFTNLIYEINGKKAKIPIFRGNMGDVTHEEFQEYCYNNNLMKRGYGEGGFVVISKKGKLTDTFHEFLNFYKGNILKDVDINKPTSFEAWNDLEGKPGPSLLTIYYDFKVNGIPFVLFIGGTYSAERIDDSDSVKSIFDVKLKEMTNPPKFTYTFFENMSYKDF